MRIAVILSSSFEEGGAVEQSAALAMEELILKNRDQLDKLLLCELPPLPSGEQYH